MFSGVSWSGIKSTQCCGHGWSFLRLNRIEMPMASIYVCIEELSFSLVMTAFFCALFKVEFGGADFEMPLRVSVCCCCANPEYCRIGGHALVFRRCCLLKTTSTTTIWTGRQLSSSNSRNNSCSFLEKPICLPRRLLPSAIYSVRSTSSFILPLHPHCRDFSPKIDTKWVMSFLVSSFLTSKLQPLEGYVFWSSCLLKNYFIPPHDFGVSERCRICIHVWGFGDGSKS